MAEQPTENGSGSLLDLTTKQATPFITVDGEKFHYRDINALSIADRQRLAAKGKWLQRTFQEIRNVGSDPDAPIEEWGKEEEESFNFQLNALFLQVLKDGERLKGVLSDNQKLEVIANFFPKSSPPTDSPKKSPDLDDSTVAVSKTGSA